MTLGTAVLGTVFLFTQFAFLYLQESLARIEQMLGFKPINSSIATPHISSFILRTLTIVMF